MDKNQVTQALEKVKANSPKRNFRQSYDLVINLTHIDLKKAEHKVDFYTQLSHPTGKQIKVCALVGPELRESAKSNCDEAILADDFLKYKDKKSIKKLANSYDYFIAQATIMPKIATAFGRVFGPKGKMPSPKAGCVVPPNANLKPLVDKLKKTVRLRTINDPVIRCLVGKEDMKDEEVMDNIMSIYDQVIHHLPEGKHNVKNICLKLSMGPVVKVGEKTEEETKGKKKAKPKAEAPKAEEKPAEAPKAKEEPKPEPKDKPKEEAEK
ncbi:50S ribosomal protein L1 [Candidatus Woesearchaeota archaeon]|nr:50S ribosomal protein L1 [Candidatus Woesearchaeota archaeon]